MCDQFKGLRKIVKIRSFFKRQNIFPPHMVQVQHMPLFPPTKLPISFLFARSSHPSSEKSPLHLLWHDVMDTHSVCPLLPPPPEKKSHTMLRLKICWRQTSAKKIDWGDTGGFGWDKRGRRDRRSHFGRVLWYQNGEQNFSFVNIHYNNFTGTESNVLLVMLLLFKNGLILLMHTTVCWSMVAIDENLFHHQFFGLETKKKRKERKWLWPGDQFGIPFFPLLIR